MCEKVIFAAHLRDGGRRSLPAAAHEPAMSFGFCCPHGKRYPSLSERNCSHRPNQPEAPSRESDRVKHGKFSATRSFLPITPENRSVGEDPKGLRLCLGCKVTKLSKKNDSRIECVFPSSLFRSRSTACATISGTNRTSWPQGVCGSTFHNKIWSQPCHRPCLESAGYLEATREISRSAIRYNCRLDHQRF